MPPKHDYSLPPNIVKSLERVETSLGENFDRVWGALRPDAERDEIMYHILQAKRKLHQLLQDEADNHA